MPVAKAMGAPKFQPTLHKIAAGNVASPSRSSAERIAKHFAIPIEALYDPKAAATTYRLVVGLGVAEPQPAAYVQPASKDPLQEAIKVIASELEGAKTSTRRAVGSLLSSLAESPSESGDIGRQVRSLLNASKRKVANGE